MPINPNHGKTSVLYMSATGTTLAVNVVGLTSWSLDKATDLVEVSAMGDANKSYVQGLPDVKGSFAGVFDSGTDQLFDGADSADGVLMYLYPNALVPTVYHYGPAWVNASIATGVTAAVTVSGSFAAKGAWGRKP